jgi:DNA-binding transcriptional regulator YiaG
MNIAQARHNLGLSLSEFAALHQMSKHAVRRWEMPVDASGYREPSGSAKAFTQALLDGYRP